MQESQEGKRCKLWGPRAHFGANISMKIIQLIQRQIKSLYLTPGSKLMVSETFQQLQI